MSQKSIKFLLSVLVLVICTGAAFADQIVLEYTFDRPDIENIFIDGEYYDRVSMVKAPNGGDIGHPALPARGARILIPYGSEIESIEINYDNVISLGDGYNIEPIGTPVKLSADPGSGMPLRPDPEIYNSDQPFPKELYQNIGINHFRGYQILTLKLQPMEYLPVTGELLYYPELKVTVNTIDAGKEAQLFRGLPEDELALGSKVDNPDMADSYYAAGVSKSKNFDLLIITTSTLASSFQPLKDYHDTTGVMTEIHTTATIGSTDPDDIRDYIRERYLNDGIRFVIIGADDDIIPAKDLYVVSWEGSGAETEYSMPADLYFACLDGTYNYDGDSNWGEPTDGEGGGDVDLYAEVNVGRASVGNATEADRFVNKTIQYVTSSSPYLENVLMVGEYLGFGGISDYAKTMMLQNVDGSSADGYTTVGIPSDVYNVDGLYEQDYTWPQSDLTNAINGGMHILNHLGHGSPDYAMKFYNSDILSQLSNTDHCFVYSQTCLAGHFDDTECWSETMNIKTDAGAFGVIMNARYGWGSNSSTDGPSQRFNREFWDAIFNPFEGRAGIGSANHDSKEDNVYRINESCMRWCCYELNLFGDPTVFIKGVSSLAFSFPEGVPEIVPPSTASTFEVTISAVGDGVPVPNSGMLHYSINNGPIQDVLMTPLSSYEYNATLPVLSCGDSLEFYVSVEEVANGRLYYPDPSTPFSAIVATNVTTIFEDNFETSQGWTVSGDAGDGQWNRGDPVGGGDRGDPADDYDGSGQCYLTDNVDDNSDVDDGTTILTSPTFDLSTANSAQIHFAFWYSNNNGGDPNNDEMQMYISDNNGSSWVLLEELGPTYHANGSWFEYTYQVADFVSLTSQVKVRFDVSDLGSGSVIEAGLDDFQIIDYVCEGTTEPVITTTDLPDWTVGIAYNQTLEATGGTGALTWSDKYGDLSGTGLNLSTDGILSGIPSSTGTISFTVEVVDEAKSRAADEQVLSFDINPAVAMTSSTLPDWTAGYAYSQQLTSTGGTGSIAWIDKNNDLSGTGLTLSGSGLLSGTPLVGPVSFTAQATDEASSTDEGGLSFTVNPAITVTTVSLPEWTAGFAYSEQIDVTGGTGALTWTDKYGNLSGTGLTLSTTGLVSGTPVAGAISFTAEVADNIGAAGNKVFNFTVNPAVNVTTTSLSAWTIGVPYSSQLESSGGTGVITWIDKYGDLTSTGLSILSDGTLSGTPLAEGTIDFTAEASDALGSTDDQALTFTINPAVTIITASLPNWTEGYPYSQQFDAAGGTGIKTWTDKYNNLTGTGLTLSGNGLISGTPVAGPVGFTAEVVDEAGDTEEILINFTINDALTFVTTSLPDGTDGALYNEQVDVTGGTGVVVCTDLNDNLLGFGLSMSIDGLITGTLTDTGTVEFTVYVEDGIGANSQQIFSFYVGVEYICGDADNDGIGPNVADLIYLVDFIFKAGPPPQILEAGNVDGIINSGLLVDVGDLTYLVAYIFAGGDAPICE